MMACVCALGLLFALSCWLVSEIPSDSIWNEKSQHFQLPATKSFHEQFLDSIWFAFIASTTIGLGDIVPPARELHLVLVHFFFLLIGVTLVGLLISAAVRSYASLHYTIEAKAAMTISCCLVACKRKKEKDGSPKTLPPEVVGEQIGFLGVGAANSGMQETPLQVQLSSAVTKETVGAASSGMQENPMHVQRAVAVASKGATVV
jgi:hypothetical protein